MQEELECSSSHLRPAQTAAAFQWGCMAIDDRVPSSGRNKALHFLPGTAFPLAQPGRKAAPLIPVLFQLVSLSKESSSLHSLRTPFPTNQQSRIGSLIGQCRGVFPRLPAASPAAAQAGLADMDPPDPPSEGRSGHQLPHLPEIPAQRDWGALEWSSPTSQRLNTQLPP